MNGLFSAAELVQDLCQREGWRFCFIGGLAVQRWGEPRVTRDVDLTLLTAYGEEAERASRLLTAFRARIDDPIALAARARVVLLRTDAGVPVDVALGALPFEERSVERASAWTVPGARPLRTCSAEDLLVHKVFAGRDRDWADVAGVIARQGPTLDVGLVVEELEPLLAVRGGPQALARLRGLLS